MPQDETKNIEIIDYFQKDKKLLGRIRSYFASRARKRMFDRFMALTKPKPTDLVLDLGVTPDCSFPDANFFEKMYPYTDKITMGSIEDASNLEEVFKGAKFVRTTPGKALPFGDKQFDILFCSAVLEHVGDYESQMFFIRECIRVAKKIYLTTPNRWFPIEFHTYLPLVHWLPQKMHQRILRMLSMGFWAKTENLNLLSASKLRNIMSGGGTMCTVYKNRLFGWVSNLVLYVEEE